MTVLASTAPAAITTLQGHFTTVAADNPSLNLGVFLGMPPTNLPDNYLQIGDIDTGALIVDYVQEWASLPAGRKSEEYTIPCGLRCWTGATDPTDTLTSAFTVIDGVLAQLAGDVGGSGSLSPSGSWELDELELPRSGPFTAGGWGVLATFNVHVRNVRIVPS